MKYDRDSWHYNGDYPEDLPPENGGTHIGMFLAWCILHGLIGKVHQRQSKCELDAVASRLMTGRQFLASCCNGRFWDCDLNDEGNAFAREYYGGDGKSGEYFEDYFDTLGADLPSSYHVEDTWENYDLIAEVIDLAYADWREENGR